MVIRNRKANLGIAIGGAVLVLSGLFGLFLACFSIDQLVWPMLLFEPIVIGGGIAALCVGLGVQRSGVPMALATVAGCVAVAGFLSSVAGRNSLGSGMLVPMLSVRMLVSVAFVLYAAWLVLGPHRDAWRRLVLGSVLLALGLGIAAVGFIGPARPVREWLLSLGGFAASAAALVLFVVFVILTAGGVHLVVRPFEMAFDGDKPENSPTR